MDRAHTFEQTRRSLGFDRCVECGDCLVHCRYMDLDRRAAQREVALIKQGAIRESIAMSECRSCYACNTVCPTDAHPYERIHLLWAQHHFTDGLPIRAQYILPSSSWEHFRQDLPFDSRERTLHRRWSVEQPPGPICLFAGCNLLAAPRLAEGAIFDHLPVWGRFDLCCGEMFWRMGLVEAAARHAARLEAFFRGKPVEELVLLCPAGQQMLTHIFPEHLGVRLPFRVTGFADWMLAALDSGRIRLQQPFRGESIVLHDSCQGRLLGEAFMDRQRELLERLGLMVYETPRNRTSGLCCGIASGCKSLDPRHVIADGMRQLVELDRAPGDLIAVYCTGCLHTLNALGQLKGLLPDAPDSLWGRRKPIASVLELVRQALGERIELDGAARARQMLLGIARHALPALVSPARFQP
ncbi:MAG: (Fe-S)-binding protein [Deltaproteobacteria bacterium]|nr:(Fe-S)-binding protein [Deltaproteobacteria bacterium]